MPPAEPGPMRQPEPARTPTGPTTSGDSYYADRAREQYSRRKGAEVAEDSQVIKQLAEIVARRRDLRMKTPSDFSIAEIVAGRKAQGEKDTKAAISVRNSTAEIRPTFNLDSVKPNGRMAGGDEAKSA